MKQMTLKVIGSSSHGCCYLIENENRYLALDAGMAWRKVQVACEFMVSNIDACLVTHGHG